ncbi:MAG: hypothetical protein N3D72_02775 [Candidatus Methanomethyliaceae archaeon]|nr:hypothetical protein [Candidatus Methanomethyliaceae archaeon]
MKLYRSRYILFKISGQIDEEEFLFYIRAILLPHKIKITFKKWPFIIVKIDHKSWEQFKEQFKRSSKPRILIQSKRFSISSIKTSGTIKKLKEKIKVNSLFN